MAIDMLLYKGDKRSRMHTAASLTYGEVP